MFMHKNLIAFFTDDKSYTHPHLNHFDEVMLADEEEEEANEKYAIRKKISCDESHKNNIFSS